MNKKLTITLKVDAKTGEVTTVRNSFDKLDRKVRKTNHTLSEAKNMFRGLVAVMGLREIIQYADVFTSLETKIKLVTTSMEQLKAVEYELFKISNESRTSIESTADLYNKLARSSKNLGYTHTDLLGVTESITKALTISGDTAASSDAALMQLGQGLASGALRGQELNSVMEQTPRLAQAIADGMGISIGELRKVAEQGNITSKVVIDAIISQAQTLNTEFKDVSLTVAQSMIVAKNSFISVIGGINEATGASITLAEVISDGAGFITEHTDDIAQGFLGIKLVFQVLKQDFFQLVVWIDEGMQTTGQAWYTLTASMQNAWKISADTIGTLYYDLVNYLLGLINTTVNNMSSALGGAFELVGVDNPFEKINLSLGKYQSHIKEAVADTFILSGTDWAKTNLTQSATDVLDTYEKLRKGIHVSSGENKKALNGYIKGARETIKTNKNNTKSLKAQAKAATKALEAQKKLNREYMKLTGDRSGLFQVDVEATMKEFIDSGRYSGEQLSKIYDAMWNKYQDKGKESAFNVNTWMKEAFDIDSDSIFGKLFDSFSDLFGGFTDALKEGGGLNKTLASMDLGVKGADMLQKSGDPTMKAIGYSLEAIGAMFSNTLSEAEIKAATGRSEFESKSLSTMRELAETNPLLPLTQSMLLHLNSMDDKFGAIASAISSTSNGLDLDGSDFQSTDSYGALGFSSKHKELIGAGIEFGKQTISGFLEGVDAVGYEAIKVSSSSFWGLRKTEKIKENMKELPESLKKDLGLAFGEAIASVMDAVEILGFDTTAIQAKLDAYVLDLGKLNFKDLDASEQQQALSNAFSEQLDTAFGQAIASIASPQNVAALESLSHAGESYTETLVRAAVSHEAVRVQLAMFGQTATDFVGSNVLVDAAGGLEAFQNGMQAFVSGFYTGEEQQEMMKLQLEMALMVHNIALPASKEQFKALVLETQQKILTLKATIQTMKAEIVAKGEGNKAMFGLVVEGEKAKVALTQAGVQAQVESNNFLIDSAHNAGKASVGFGKSINNSIKAMATGAGEAVVEGAQTAANGGDVDWDAITSPAIASMEAELASLEGLYGTLMQNMGSFSDYYGGVESAATSAADAMTELEKSLVSLANLKAVWGEDDVSAKKIILDATIRNTGLTDLTYENFLPRLTAETADGLGMTQAELQKWEDMSKALRDLHDALDRRTEEEKEAVRKDLNFYENILKQIEDTFTGSLSSLSSYEKADYAAQAAQRYQAEGDTQNYIRMIQTQVESERKISTTREEYERSLFAYREELRRQNPQDIEEQQLETLQDINDKLIDVEQAIEDSSIYQSSRSA